MCLTYFWVIVVILITHWDVHCQIIMKIQNLPLNFLYNSLIWGCTTWSSCIMQESFIHLKLKTIREASITHLYLPPGPTSYQWTTSHSMGNCEHKFKVFLVATVLRHGLVTQSPITNVIFTTVYIFRAMLMRRVSPVLPAGVSYTHEWQTKPYSSGSQSVLCESQRICTHFSVDMWTHFCNGYFEIWSLTKNNHRTSLLVMWSFCMTIRTLN
jgi:hypothetical protein